jgi:hypothetical protein
VALLAPLIGARPVCARTAAIAAGKATAEVTAGTITAAVTASRSVASPSQAALLPQWRPPGGVDGECRPVAEGRPLARIDDTELRVRLSQSRATQQRRCQVRAAQGREPGRGCRRRPGHVRCGGPGWMKRAAVQGRPSRLPRASCRQPESGSSNERRSVRGHLRRPGSARSAQARLQALTHQGWKMSRRRTPSWRAQAKLRQLTTPRPEDLATAQSQLGGQSQAAPAPEIRDLKTCAPRTRRDASASRLQALTSPRPEDIAA